MDQDGFGLIRYQFISKSTLFPHLQSICCMEPLRELTVHSKSITGQSQLPLMSAISLLVQFCVSSLLSSRFPAQLTQQRSKRGNRDKRGSREKKGEVKEKNENNYIKALARAR